jgi:transcriptional regulator with XRE-family HTH domain
MHDRIREIPLGMFGKNLKRIRAQRDMTQAKVSELAGIHKRYYQDVEACVKVPSVAIAARLRKALKCDWTDLTRGL